MDRKEQMKALRAERKESIGRTRNRMKTLNQQIKQVQEALAKGPATPPEVAEAAGLDSAKALWILMALKKFGQVAEEKKAGAYFKYELVEA